MAIEADPIDLELLTPLKETIDFLELSGDISFRLSDSHDDWFMRNMTGLMVTQSFPNGLQWANFSVFYNGMKTDVSFLHAVAADLLYTLAPWRKSDPNPMPYFVLFPRLERFTQWWAKGRKNRWHRQ